MSIEVEVQIKGDRFKAKARTATPEEKPEMWRIIKMMLLQAGRGGGWRHLGRADAGGARAWPKRWCWWRCSLPPVNCVKASTALATNQTHQWPWRCHWMVIH